MSGKQLRLVAKVISKVFDPVIIIPLILAGVVGFAYLNGFKWHIYGALFVTDALLPGLFFVGRLMKRGMWDWDIHRREDRLPLFIFTLICHAGGVGVAYFYDRHPLTEMLLVLWIVALVYVIITNYWKISIHAGVNATLATLVFWFLGEQYAWVLFVPVVVSWARIVDHDHTYTQVLAGMVVAPVIIGTLFWWLQVGMVF